MLVCGSTSLKRGARKVPLGTNPQCRSVSRNRIKKPIQDVQTLRPRDLDNPWGEKFYPYPEEPESPHHVVDARTISDSWLAARHNDGHGSRSAHLQTFFWRVGNAFNLKALREFKGHAGRLDQSALLVCAIFRAAEGYDFCPGADLIALLEGDHAYRKEFYKTTQEVCYVMATMKTPAFACMQGNTMGLGAALTAHSLFRVVTETAMWAMPNVLYGAIPDGGMSFILPRVKGEVGMYLALTGKRVDSTDVVRIGIATHFIPLDSLVRFEQETGRVFTSNMEDMFVFLNPHLNHNIDSLQKSALEPNLDAIQRCFDKSTLEEVFEALENEKTAWGSRTLKRLKEECSPLLLHVTFRLMRIGRYFNNLEEALEIEYRIMQHVITHPDFEEGIRSRMVLKRTPKWKHDSIYEVQPAEIAEFFAPLPDELDLKPSQPGRRPDKNPYRVYIDQMQAWLKEPMTDPLLHRHIDKILPATATLEEARAFYRSIMKEGGLDHEAGRYWKKIESIQQHNPENLNKEEMEKQTFQYASAHDPFLEVLEGLPDASAEAAKPTDDEEEDDEEEDEPQKKKPSPFPTQEKERG